MTRLDTFMLKLLALAFVLASVAYITGVHSFDGSSDPAKPTITVDISSTSTERG